MITGPPAQGACSPGRQQITAFADQLARSLYALDTPGHFAAVRSFAIGDDSFLYIRCAAVAAGRTSYEKVLAKPETLARFADHDAEPLLAVAADAYERSTGMLWEHETPVSYEIGSNTAAWGERASAVEAAAPEVPNSWLTLHAGWGMPEGWPLATPNFSRHVTLSMAHDPVWTRWWAGTGTLECRLSLLLDSTGMVPPGTTIKTGRTRIETNIVRHPAPFTTDDPVGLLPRAVDEVISMLQAVREQCDLPALPQLSLSELPADIPYGFAVDQEDPVPPLPPELLKRLTRQNGLPHRHRVVLPPQSGRPRR